MRCEEIMKKDVKCISPRDTAASAALKMRDQNIGFLPVCDDEDKILGALTDRDIAVRLVAARKSADTPAGDLMTTDCVSCAPDDDLEHAAEMMAKHQKSRVMCTDEDGRLVGVISLSDIAQNGGESASQTLRRVSSREAKPLRP
jgi:CBS domain-containing protein